MTDQDLPQNQSQVQDDTAKAQGVYAAAVTCAKAEYDMLLPQARELEIRMRDLRLVIAGGSGLTGQLVEERYSLIRSHAQQSNRPQQGPGTNRGSSR